MFSYKLKILVLSIPIVCLSSTSLTADVLFDNGSYSGNQTNTRNIANSPTSQRIFDDFTLLRDSEVTGFEWMQHDRFDLEYTNTEIRIYAGLPEALNLVYEANVVATRTPNATGPLFDDWDGFDYEVNGLSIQLPAGTYFLGLNTKSSRGDTSWDQTLGNPSTIPGRRVVNEINPEPGLFLGNQDSVFKVVGVDYTEVLIDIKFCSDPNAFNCKKKGVLPVTIFGTDTFDVADIDVSTLQLCSEGGDCTGIPRDYSIADRGDPDSDIGAAQCDFIEVDEGVFEEQDYLNPDGFMDLDVAFEAGEVQDILGEFCGADKGTISETLMLTGSTWDGIPIVSVPVGNLGIDQLLKQNK